MAIGNRVESLNQRHAELDEQLHHEHAKPQPDDAEIKRLKIAKLHLKDEIAALSGR